MTLPVYKRGQTLTFSVYGRESGDTLEADLKVSQENENPISTIPIADSFSVAEITDATEGDGWTFSLSAAETAALDVGVYAYDAKITNGSVVIYTQTDKFELIDGITE